MKPDRPMIEQLREAEPPGPRSIHAHVTRPIVQQLVKAEAHTVLDLGCGDGWFTSALDRCGFAVTGVDKSEASLRLAQQHYPNLGFHQADVMHPLDESLAQRFDAVVAVNVIDHMALPRKLVEAALAALRPGGLLVITSNFHGYSKNIALALAGRFDARWDPLLDHGQVKFFSRTTLTSLLSEFELRDLHFETAGRIPMFARTMLMSATAPG
ncbi:MAG: class I SAM-dependent methyltransferase [Cytophagales bacterium]|nr:class I SAM-dependent methyltransferase [Rhizobacter sp.]